MSDGVVVRTSVGRPLKETHYTPGREKIVIPKGSYLMHDVIIDGDEDLVPENIVKGINLFGVVGTRTPDNMLLFTGTEEPETKLGLWIPCDAEINTIIFSPELAVETGEYPEGTLILPISTYNHFALSEMMPIVYSSAPYVYANGELIRWETAKIGDGEKWNSFNISMPLIQGGTPNASFFEVYDRYLYCQTPNYPTMYTQSSFAEVNGVTKLFLNQRSMHNVYATWISNKPLDVSKYSEMVITAKTTIEHNIGGEPTNYESYAGARIGFKTSASSVMVNNFRAMTDLDPSLEVYKVDISGINEAYLAYQLQAYEYGAITVEISSIILG